MGFGSISIWQLLVIFAIVVLIFGTKKLKNLGGDLGGAIKSFKKAVSDDGTEQKSDSTNQTKDSQTNQTSNEDLQTSQKTNQTQDK